MSSPQRHSCFSPARTFSAFCAILMMAACDAGTGPEDGGRTQRVTVYANGGLGPGGTPSEVWINDEYIGTLTQELNPPPMSTCDQPGGVSVDVPRSKVLTMRATRTTDGATWGDHTVERSSNSDCVVLWVGAHMFPPPGDGGGGGAATDCVVILSFNGSPLGFSEWENVCGYKVHFAWFDQGFCAPTAVGDGTYIGCGGALDAYAKDTHTSLSGSVAWGACRDPDFPVNWHTLDANGLPTRFSCQ